MSFSCVPYTLIKSTFFWNALSCGYCGCLRPHSPTSMIPKLLCTSEFDLSLSKSCQFPQFDSSGVIVCVCMAHVGTHRCMWMNSVGNSLPCPCGLAPSELPVSLPSSIYRPSTPIENKCILSSIMSIWHDEQAGWVEAYPQIGGEWL